MPPQKTELRKWKPPKGPKNTPHKNKNTAGLGRTLENAKVKKNQGYYLPTGELQFTTDRPEPSFVKLQSVTQENPLDEFLNTAELQDKEFTADRQAGIKIVRVANQPIENSNYNPYLLTSNEESAKFKLQEEHRSELTVPRRPAWDENTTKLELDRNEKIAFLEWRRQLAMLQQNNDLLLTPFERNLNLWKQLWRVIESSDLVVQIVDARDPLLFRSGDLVKYVKELDSRKCNLLLVNKADLLTFNQRLSWARYFRKHNIKFTFFSAVRANEILEKQREEEEKRALSKEEEEEEEEEEDDEQDLDEVLNEDEKAEMAELKQQLAELDDHLDSLNIENEEASEMTDKILKQMTKILTVDELEDLFLSEVSAPLIEPLPGQPKRVQIGLVGYPNVGKSSTINALVGSKKVSVSATPGKTKHYQTILLSEKVILCDCPGLVFPNFAYTNAELVCNGVLPIDQLRESTGPTELVCRRIPKYFLEAVYGIKVVTKPLEEGGSGIPSAGELLGAYARARGYMTSGNGSADESRAARYILKDYVSGKILYVQPPPHNDGSRATQDESRAFNNELYTLEHLPAQRRQLLISAITDKGLSTSDFDLSKDMDTITLATSSNDESQLPIRLTQKQRLEQQTVSQELDSDFFKMNNVRGVLDSPFHQKTLLKNKRHNKMNRKAKKKGTV
ncbi:hypothetical protein FOA43_001583 [Brettanomyces nanus]|uniref:CP-type G domain-containing protein n=1 Tax=Eeniella nana TaxID=13502 RepID=A0A875RZV3_EENNA|nr:uncharacterized protein FOA43_001583 [Brettanomyces nanus]QPG74258.1 hypothetical protein FOA43_001583 [Brettanomyces nanus]